MSFKILEKNGVDNENIDGGALNNFIAGGRDCVVGGVLSECAIISVNNGIVVSAGLLIIHGIRIKITEQEFLAISSVPVTPVAYNVMAQVSVLNNDVDFTIFLQERDILPIQDNFYKKGDGIYQAILGTFTHNQDGSVTNIVKTLDTFFGSQGGGDVPLEVGRVDSASLPSGSDAVFDVTMRYDKEKNKNYLDFYAGFPAAAQVDLSNYTTKKESSETRKLVDDLYSGKDGATAAQSAQSGYAYYAYYYGKEDENAPNGTGVSPKGIIDSKFKEIDSAIATKVVKGDAGLISEKSEPIPVPTDFSPYVILNSSNNSAYVRKLHLTAENTIYSPDPTCKYYAVIKGAGANLSYKGKYRIVWMVDSFSVYGSSSSNPERASAVMNNISYYSTDSYSTLTEAENAIKDQSTQYTKGTALTYFSTDVNYYVGIEHPVVKTNINKDTPYVLSISNGTYKKESRNTYSPFDGYLEGSIKNEYVKLLDADDEKSFATKTDVIAKYTKPSTGIPESDINASLIEKINNKIEGDAVIVHSASLPTASSTSPDFVEINGVLYRKKKAIVQPINGKLEGGWKVKSTFGSFSTAFDTGISKTAIGYIVNSANVQTQIYGARYSSDQLWLDDDPNYSSGTRGISMINTDENRVVDDRDVVFNSSADSITNNAQLLNAMQAFYTKVAYEKYSYEEVRAFNPNGTYTGITVGKAVADGNNRNIVNTYATKSELNAKYTKPSTGIPETDLSQTVRDKLSREHTIPVASPTILGGVKPVAKTAEMIQSVGVDTNGALFTKPYQSLEIANNSDIDALFIDVQISNKLNGGALVGSHTYQVKGDALKSITISSDDYNDGEGGKGDGISTPTLERCVTVSGSTITVETGLILGDGGSYLSGQGTATGTVTVQLLFESGYMATDSFTFQSIWEYRICYVEGTKIRMADGTNKAVEDIRVGDILSVWNFDEGKADVAPVFWVMKKKTSPTYWRITLSDQTVLKLVGINGKSHRLFNIEQGKFIYPQDFAKDEHTVKADGTPVKVISCDEVNELVNYYNFQTAYHINNYAEDVLCGCRFSNIYPIENMRFQKGEIELKPRTDFAEIPDKYFYGLRLAEQKETSNSGIQFHKTVKDHVIHNYIENAMEDNYGKNN